MSEQFTEAMEARGQARPRNVQAATGSAPSKGKEQEREQGAPRSREVSERFAASVEVRLQTSRREMEPADRKAKEAETERRERDEALKVLNKHHEKPE